MKVEMPHPIPAIEYFSSEDAPLLSDYPPNIHLDVYHYPHHGDFEVATFPATPILPEVSHAHDDDFSEFVQSPTSEVPPTPKGKEAQKVSSIGKLTDMFVLGYIRQVAIILFIQLLIPIPFMVPLGINFMKRSVKVFTPGFALTFLGHTLMNLMLALPSARPFDPSSAHHPPNQTPGTSDVFSIFWSQLKVVMLGGVVVGAIMANVINFAIVGHILHSLVRRVEPDPTVMRRAMDASAAYRRTQPVLLDLLTALFMVPAGIASRNRLFGLSADNKLSAVHLTLVGVIGVAAVHALRLVQQSRSPQCAHSTDVQQGIEHIEMRSAKGKGLVGR